MPEQQEDRLATYNMRYWGEEYLSVAPDGQVQMHPLGKEHHARIELASLKERAQELDLQLPVLFRFPNILHHRINRLCDAFNKAQDQLGFQGGYTAVYPIKVNQQRRVVEEIIRTEPAGSRGQIGLEAGSKPELIAVLALNRPGAKIVCNGYKDREFIRLALLGQMLGHQVYIVVEKLSELRLILDESRQLGVKPLIGVRARLASIGKGNWQNTGGEKSKFGLSASQLLEVVRVLHQEDAISYLQLLHFHLGSQIANIRDIQTGLRECARYYGELLQQGADIQIVDVGGGLGIDYEGTRSRSACSINYSLDDYAYHVVRTLKEECDTQQLPHPHIITESGRAMTAHHAVLITNAIDQERVDELSDISHLQPSADAPPILQELWDNLSILQQDAQSSSSLEGRPQRSLLEVFHDSSHALHEAQQMFIHGVLGMQQRAEAETLYQQLCVRLKRQLSIGNRSHREILDELNEKLADKVFVNFSLFQSLPDIWGIDQIFPVLPLTHLDKEPSRRGVIQDITCDSDGRIDQYVDNDGIETTLLLPEQPASEELLLGFFLTGAYQEILGDMHNLFGDTNSVDVYLSDDGEVRLEHAIAGDTVAKVLRYVNFSPEELLQQWQQKIAQSSLDTAQQKVCLNALQHGLDGYTYLED